MNIYIKVYLDKNYGDDLMLFQLVEALSPFGMIYVHCEEKVSSFYNQLLKSFNHVKLVQCPLRHIHRKYRKGFFSAIILLGGSVLMGNRYLGCWYRFLNIAYLSLMRRQKTEYIIMGCNVGPFKNRFTEFWVKKEIKQAAFITTRDRYSYQYLRKYAEKSSQVYYFPDMLMQTAQNYHIYPTESTGRLGIAVHGPSEASLSPFLAKICEEYIERTNQPVTLFCFDTETQNDVKAAQNICSRLHRKDMVDIVTHCAEAFQILQQMAACNRLVAVRFHAAVLAVSLNIPFLAISYSNKMHCFLNDIGQIEKEYFVSSISQQSPTAFLDTLMENPIIPKADWGLRSREHFDVVVNYLKEKGEKII
jgi:Uncharacterized conserved protein